MATESSSPPLSWVVRSLSACEIRDQSLCVDALLSAEFLASLNSSGSSVTDVVRTCGKLSERELDLTEGHDASALLALLLEQKATAEEVLVAFRKRATLAQQLVKAT